jgi:hypothetical protein
MNSDRFAGLGPDGVGMLRLLLEAQRPPAGFGVPDDVDPEEAALRIAVACLGDGPSQSLAPMESK